MRSQSLQKIVTALGIFFLFVGTPASAQISAAAGVVHQLLREPLSDQPGTDVVEITVDYAPDGSTPPHKHPGYVYAYVLEGTMISQLDDQKPHTYTAGQTWSEQPNEHHLVSKNASTTAPAKLLVFFIIPHEEPLIEYLPAK